MGIWSVSGIAQMEWFGGRKRNLREGRGRVIRTIVTRKGGMILSYPITRRSSELDLDHLGKTKTKTKTKTGTISAQSQSMLPCSHAPYFHPTLLPVTQSPRLQLIRHAMVDHESVLKVVSPVRAI